MVKRLVYRMGEYCFQHDQMKMRKEQARGQRYGRLAGRGIRRAGCRRDAGGTW